MKVIKATDFESYLSAMRVQIGVHGLDEVKAKDDLKKRCLGFESPDGWWKVHLKKIREAAAVDIVQVKNKRLNASSFMRWFQEKMAEAVSEGRKLRSEGLS